LYYARTSYFVRTTAVKDEMLARNAQMDWHPPEVGTGRFGEWLAGNIDWAISRDRYWGTPLPLWVCDNDRAHTEAIGSYAELAQKTGQPLPENFDPHKPEIDRYTWTCAQCGGTMRRVNEVIDAWFDSGSMPFAQWHFPFEHRHVVERQFPADFIAEGVDQTRGWFYSMLAIATTLGDALPNNENGRASPYRSVVVNDLVLDANGQKMSKSRGNALDPWAVINRHGADADAGQQVGERVPGGPAVGSLPDTATDAARGLPRGLRLGDEARHRAHKWRPSLGFKRHRSQTPGCVRWPLRTRYAA